MVLEVVGCDTAAAAVRAGSVSAGSRLICAALTPCNPRIPH